MTKILQGSVCSRSVDCDEMVVQSSFADVFNIVIAGELVFNYQLFAHLGTV